MKMMKTHKQQIKLCQLQHPTNVASDSKQPSVSPQIFLPLTFDSNGGDGISANVDDIPGHVVEGHELGDDLLQKMREDALMGQG